LQTTTGNAIGEGVSIGLTSGTAQEKTKAFANLLLSSILTALSAIPGIGSFASALFSGLGGIRLGGGGYLDRGLWRSFAGGGSDFGSWINSPTLVMGQRNNAIVGDVAGGEVVQNMPQLGRMIKAIAGTTGGTQNIYTQGLIGQTHVNEGVRTAYQGASVRQRRTER
jgi:hypothetical protein